MKSVTLISPTPLNLRAACDSYQGIGRVDLQSPNRLVVEGDWGWFGIDTYQRVREDFDSKQIERFEQLVQTPFFAQLEYRNERAAELALDRLPGAATTYLDNDHGFVAEVSEIRRRLRAGVDWQAVSS